MAFEGYAEIVTPFFGKIRSTLFRSFCDKEFKVGKLEQEQHLIVIDCRLSKHFISVLFVPIHKLEELGGEVVEALFLIELSDLNGREVLSDYKVDSVVQFEGA